MADLSQPATPKHLKQTVDNMKTYVSDVTDDLVSEEALNTKLEDYAKTEDIVERCTIFGRSFNRTGCRMLNFYLFIFAPHNFTH